VLSKTDDLRIRELKELSTPDEVMREIPRTLTATRVVMAARNAIHAILNGQVIGFWLSSTPARCTIPMRPSIMPSCLPHCPKT
jgi:hypothetical protein